ncbi:hypothetical protein PTKIN_Ptkin03bG0119200 [Pterospermum kingtungense]
MRQELMGQLTSNDLASRSIIRMGPHAFLQLCNKLRATGRLKDYRRATVEEQVAKFLHILGKIGLTVQSPFISIDPMRRQVVIFTMS